MDTLVLDPPTTRLTLLQPSPTNPRRLTMTPTAIAKLAETISEHGVMQPILARPRPGAQPGEVPLEIVAGERRWRACRLLSEQGRNPHEDAIPCMTLALSDAQVLAMQLVENIHREDLHPLEEAEHYQRMQQDPTCPRTPAQIAATAKVDEDRVVRRLSLLALVPAVRELFLADKLFLATAQQVARMPAPVQEEIATHLANWGGERMGPKAAAAFIRERYTLRLAQAPFDPADATLCPEAGACGACPKRTGANPQLWDDAGDSDTCTDTACFRAKKAAQHERQVQELVRSGFTVLRGDDARAVCTADGRALKPGMHRLEDTVPPGLGDPALKVVEVLERGQQPNSVTRAIDHPQNPVVVYAVTTPDLEAALRKIKAHREQLDRAAARAKKAASVAPAEPQGDITPQVGQRPADAARGEQISGKTADGDTLEPAADAGPSDEQIEALLAFRPPSTVAGLYRGLTLQQYTEEREMRARAILTAGRIARAVRNDRGEGLPERHMGKMVVQLMMFGDSYLTLSEAAELLALPLPDAKSTLEERVQWLWALEDEPANQLAMVMLALQEDALFERFPAAMAEALGVDVQDVPELAKASVATHLQIGALATGSPVGKPTKPARGKAAGGAA